MMIIVLLEVKIYLLGENLYPLTVDLHVIGRCIVVDSSLSNGITTFHLLKVLALRDNFLRFRDLVNLKTLNSEEAKQIILDVDEWFSQTEASEINWEDFAEWFVVVKHPTFDEEKITKYNKIFDRLNSPKFNQELAEKIVHNFIHKDYATRLVSHLMPIIDGTVKANFDQVYALLELMEKELGTTSTAEEALVTDNIVELLEETTGVGGYNWKLAELNKSLGPIRKGDSILIAGFVDSGKTSLAVSETTFIHKQLPKDQPAIYFCNEEGGKKVKLRHVQAHLGWPVAKFKENFLATHNAYIKSMENYAPFLFFHEANMTIKFVDMLVKKYKPGLIVLDQLWNIEGFSDVSINSTDRYTNLAKWVRKLAQNAPVISVHQADGTAAGVEFIEMNQLYGSKVGMQGAMDAIVTLGRSLDQSKNQFSRGLYTPKNKMSGGVDSNPEDKNRKWEILFKPLDCEFTSPFNR
jgi:KaiC/GvpD/RAD55 family RecA-like ATPase